MGRFRPRPRRRDIRLQRTSSKFVQVKREVKKVESSNDEDCASLAWQSVMYILEGVRTVVTPREGWRRALVLLGVFQYICYISVYLGTEGSHRLYFVENKYKWSEEELSTYLFDIRIAQVSNNRFCSVYTSTVSCVGRR